MGALWRATEALAQSGADVAKGQSRNFRRRRQRRVVIAVVLATLIAAMLLAIAFFAVIRNAGG
jgi:hypothetical protein